uniref:DNA-directed RNA polymerase III subunit RPC5 n=1 Tax=Parastrongyloides trichosuri TaxID=131310 RepID=A0A0N4ZYE3_PARTI
MNTDNSNDLETAYMYELFNENDIERNEYDENVELEIPIILGKPPANLYRLQFPKPNLPLQKCDARLKRAVDVLEIQFDPTDIYEFVEVNDRETFVYKGVRNKDHKVINHAISCFKNGKMYILPLDGVYEMKRMIRGDEQLNMMAVDNTITDEKKELNPVRVKFARAETDAQKRRKEESSYYKQKMAEKDPWIPMIVKTTHKNSLLPSAKDCGHLDLQPLRKKEIVLNSRIGEVDAEALAKSGRNILNLQLEDLDFQDRIKLLFLKASVLRHSEIKNLVSFEKECVSEDDFIEIIRKYATLCKGVWTIRGEFLHTLEYMKKPRHGTKPPPSSIAALLKLRLDIHNFGLCMLQGNKRLTRGLIKNLFNVSIDDAEEILSIYAFKSGKTWKLKIDEDIDFLNDPRYRQIIEEEDESLSQWFERKLAIDRPDVLINLPNVYPLS